MKSLLLYLMVIVSSVLSQNSIAVEMETEWIAKGDGTYRLKVTPRGQFIENPDFKGATCIGYGLGSCHGALYITINNRSGTVAGNENCFAFVSTGIKPGESQAALVKRMNDNLVNQGCNTNSFVPDGTEEVCTAVRGTGGWRMGKNEHGVITFAYKGECKDESGGGEGGGGIEPPVKPLSCTVEGLPSNLQHGVLSLDKVDQHTARTSIYVRCTQNATITLKVSQERVNLDPYGKLYSKITLNNKSILTFTNVTDAPVLIKSTLTLLSNDVVGTYKKSTILIMNAI